MVRDGTDFALPSACNETVFFRGSLCMYAFWRKSRICGFVAGLGNVFLSPEEVTHRD